MTDIVYGRVDTYVDKGYLTYDPIYEYSLKPSTLFLILKVLSMREHISFPSASSANISKFSTKDMPHIFLTQEGYDVFVTQLADISENLFLVIAPIYATHFTPLEFPFKDTQTRRNCLGQEGRTSFVKKKETKYYVTVDNSGDFNYLKEEYEFQTIYTARKFILDITRFVPTTRLRLFCKRLHARGYTVTEEMPLITKRKIYRR